MIETLLIIGVVLLLVVYLRTKPSMAKTGPFLPDSYLIGIGLYVTGAVYIALFEDIPRANELFAISSLTLMSALSGSIVFSLFCSSYYGNTRFSQHFSRIDSGPIERLAVKVLLGISAVVCVIFVYVVLSSSIIGALLSIASIVSDSTLLDARKAITSGSDGYFAPGYIKQFRDIIIPVALVSTMAVNAHYRKSSLVWIAFAASLSAMVISGQRLVFVIFFVSLLLGSYYINKFSVPGINRGLGSVRIPWLSIGVMILLYGLLTIMLGRVTEGLSLFGSMLDVMLNLLDRIFLAAPRENTITLPLWYSMGPTYGASWLSDLAGILPGVSESFSNILHSNVGGSLQGNSPLGLPADIWFAWGWGGVLIIPFVYAFGIGMLDMVLLSRRSAIFFGLKIYLFVVLPICYSPFLFILYGGAVTLILIVFVAVIRTGANWSGQHAMDRP